MIAGQFFLLVQNIIMLYPNDERSSSYFGTSISLYPA
jgi:hypothetical protein